MLNSIQTNQIGLQISPKQLNIDITDSDYGADSSFNNNFYIIKVKARFIVL